MPIRMKRIYAPVEAEDGKRILVRSVVATRGTQNLRPKIDEWPKILTPSNELRKWYHQDMVAHWDEFKVRYMKELEAHPAELNDLRQLAVREQITLLTAAKKNSITMW